VSGPGVRTVRHALGHVTVPTEPRRIVALDELSGIAALAAGREPLVVYASAGDAASAAILRDAGLDVRDMSILSLPSQETLRELDPDLIVGTGAHGPTGLGHAALSAVAPTAVLGIEEAWRDLVRYTAGVFGADDVGERQVAAIADRLAAADTAGREVATLALLGFTTEPFTMAPHTPSSTLIAEAEFTRPEPERAAGERWPSRVLPELLVEHDAEVVVIPDGRGMQARRITDHPRFADLTGRVVHPVAQQWFGNNAFSFWVIAGDLRSLAGGGADVVRSDDLAAEWTRFRAATSA
jgi:iron complex transport system substrate-binding protein